MTGLATSRTLPTGLEPLRDLAADLRWTWSHAADHVWRALDPDLWSEAENPWLLLQHVPLEKLETLAGDVASVGEVNRLAAARREYLNKGGWFASTHGTRGPRGIAFFSMEFGLGEALPLYAGGLGILAGDYLKAASDLGVPAVGIGLLYHEGYFRQTIDAAGRQHEHYPYNDPTTLPVSPVLSTDGQWVRVELEFPGRIVRLRVWQAIVGRARLYLLDSNDPTNTPADRGITAKLYGGDQNVQFLQEVVLGIGGWRLIDALGVDVEVCHLNEGHAALAILERARCAMARHVTAHLTFREALWMTRAGNVFTTHTAVAAAVDRFGPGFVEQHLPFLRIYANRLGVPIGEVLALGRRDPADSNEPFNLAILATRGSTSVNGVSALHGKVSRELFQDLFPRWPQDEVPITHVTNGVHTPTWDSAAADRLWEAQCGKERWLDDLADASRAMAGVADERVWACRTEARECLVAAVRRRLARQLAARGTEPDVVMRAERVFDPHTLTLGFARRFTGYKRPTLLLQDRERLIKLLTSSRWPVQLVVAGKAHPSDDDGKRMIEDWLALGQDARVRDHLVFLEDYDITLAQELVQGVDVWINTPRRPWEACGTSGMKTLVNGGLNLSELDGWWAEAYTPAVGWAIGDGATHGELEWDSTEAEQLYRVLENEVVPDFYERDARGFPTRWLERVRASMGQLAPQFSANRMLREYVDDVYVSAAERLRQRARDGGRGARELVQWAETIDHAWSGVAFGTPDVRIARDGYVFSIPVCLGALDPGMVRVELYADPIAGELATRISMHREDSGDLGKGVVYSAEVVTTRPSSHFTPRVIPFHPNACVPAESQRIHWAW